MDFGFVKICVMSPPTAVANPAKNADSAVSAIKKAYEKGAQIIVLPELYISGYSCADLFHQSVLLNRCEEALMKILDKTRGIDSAIVIGMPISVGERLYNCAAVIQNGKLLGVVPKMYLPNYKEFYEKRWFVSGREAKETEIFICGQTVPFGKLLFKLGSKTIMGVEICEDLWAPIPPSCEMALAGANIIVNCSASNEAVSKHEYRAELIKNQSARLICAYAYSSAGIGESTTDLVFSGACMVAENGTVLAEGKRFCEEALAYACVDIDKLTAERRANVSFADASSQEKSEFRIVCGNLSVLEKHNIERNFYAYPFVPGNLKQRKQRCEEIMAIQANGLAKRMKHTGLKRPVVGISGGLDSTLALLVCAKAVDILNIPRENILCITMPGFGTTDITYTNAVELIRAIGAELMEVNIKEACIQHFKDIGHDPNIKDVTYENTQARERTQILMDCANKYNGILVGTGDLSELAMGWCTYNGDHMSMYGVNVSVPKTLVRYLVKNYADEAGGAILNVLEKILNTPVSPELLPPDENGNITQITEEKIGPYELHDFYLYYFLRFGFAPDKLLFLAERAFEGKYEKEEIERWLKLFLKRFFISQFKRSCMPDGPKVGSVSLSPRGDWRMPSDAEAEEWLNY